MFQILQIDGTDGEVKFARQRGDFFFWPDAEDISWHELDQLMHINAPTLDPKGIRMYIQKDEMLKYFS